MIELEIVDAPAMEALGRRLAPALRAGDLVLLDGELGAGKTTFTRGLGEALGARGSVTSPTFVLAREHPTEAGPPLVHVDAYRLATAVELEDLDLDWAGSIVVVEWGSGKVEESADHWLRVRIDRPRGAASPFESGASSSDEAGGAHGAGGAAPAPAELAPEDERDEPRLVRIEGEGARGRELEALLGAAAADAEE